MIGFTERRLRSLLAVIASILLVASAVMVSWARTEPGSTGPSTATAPTAGPTGGPSETPPTSPSPPTPSPEAAVELLTDPGAAEEAGATRVLEAGRAAAAGPWRDLGHPAWAVEERPVYVARVQLGDERHRVTADATIALRTDRPRDEVVLRLLPAAEALRGGDLEVEVRRDGHSVEHRLDRAGARLIVPLDEPLSAADATLLRVQLSYRLVAGQDISGDGGPASFGLLARTDTASVMGHWLPLLTVSGNRGPMVDWGDVGAFPAALWSVVVETEDRAITGGEESACPGRATTDPCVWARGVALRDLAMVVFDETVSDEDQTGGFRVRSVAPASGDLANREAQQIALRSVTSFLERFGPLAWREIDVVATPLGEGAAGMEFPGMLLIDTGVYDTMQGGFGAAVVAHEVAHQWFHALVGSGSLSAPVVDESLAQYLSYLAWSDAFGAQAAETYASQAFGARYATARANGLDDETPAQPLADFNGSDAYGALVYGRASLAWVAAEEAAGRAAVTEFLATVTDRYGLAFIDDEELVSLAEERAPEIGRVLRRYWLNPAPVDVPSNDNGSATTTGPDGQSASAGILCRVGGHAHMAC